MTSKNQIVSQSFIDDQFKMVFSSNDGPHKKKPVYENFVSPRRQLSPDEQKEIVKSGFSKVSNKSLLRLVGVRPKSRQRTTQSSKQHTFNKGRESHFNFEGYQPTKKNFAESNKDLVSSL